MSAEKSTDWLIDLLYEDEVDHEEPLEDLNPDSSEELERPHALLSPDQERELAEHRQWLGIVRQSMILAQPSASSHETLMEAARKQLITHAEREAQAVRKPQPARHSPEGTLWARARGGTIAQIASLATVLVVGIFFLGRFQDKMPTANESAPASAAIALNEVAPSPQAELPSPTALAAASPDDQQQHVTEEAAQAPSYDFPAQALGKLDKNAEAIGDTSLAMNKPGVEKPRDSRAQLEDDARRQRAGGEAPAPNDALAKNAEPSRRTSVQTTKSAGALGELDASPQDKSKPLNDLDDNINEDGFAFAGQAQDESPASPTKLAINDTAPTRTMTREAQTKPSQEAKERTAPSAADQPSAKFLSPEAPVASSGRADNVKQEERAIANAQPRPQSASGPKTDAPAKKASTKPWMPVVAAAPPREEAAEAELVADMEAKPATPSISSTERAFRADRFKDAADEADRFLKTGLGTPAERARALEIKAQAYERLGRGDDAYRVYEQLEREYPSYFKKRSIDRPKKRSKSKDDAKSKIDLMESY